MTKDWAQRSDTFWERVVTSISNLLLLPFWSKVTAAGRFLERRRRSIAIAFFVPAGLVLSDLIQHIDNMSVIAHFVMTFVWLLLAAYYLYFGGDKPRHAVGNEIAPAVGPHTIELGTVRVNLVESALRLIVVVLFLWWNDEYLGGFKPESQHLTGLTNQWRVA